MAVKHGWRTVILKDLQAPMKYALNGGPFGSKLVQRDYTPSGVPVIRGTNLSGDSYFSFDDFVYVSEEKADELLPNNAHPGDLVFTQRGTLGQVGIIPKRCGHRRFVISQSQMKLTVDETKADPFFLYYYFRAPSTIHAIDNLTVSSGVPHINLDMLRNFEVTFPPLPTQRRIAAILCAYDDLIENNTRRIAILEEMARLVYQEWFVGFRFLGHESVRLVESPRGLIPEGWKARRLGEMCRIVMGQSPKSEFYNEEGRGLPFHQGVKDFGSLFPTTRVYCTVTERVAEAGDVLFSVRAPVGRINIADRTIVLGRGLCAIRSKKGHQAFIFLQLRDRFQEEDSIGGGTIFKAVTKMDMHGIQILVPPGDLIAMFEQTVCPMFSAMRVLTEKNVNLRHTRDLLLPRLVSGEVDVSELDING